MVLVVSLHSFQNPDCMILSPTLKLICQFIFVHIGIINRIIYIILIERINIPLLFDMLSKHGSVISKPSFVSTV